MIDRGLQCCGIADTSDKLSQINTERHQLDNRMLRAVFTLAACAVRTLPTVYNTVCIPAIGVCDIRLATQRVFQCLSVTVIIRIT